MLHVFGRVWREPEKSVKYAFAQAEGRPGRDEPQYRSNTEKSDVLTDKSLYYRRKAIGSLVGRDCMVVAFVGSRGPIPSLHMPFPPEMGDW